MEYVSNSLLFREKFSRNSSSQWRRDFEKEEKGMPPVTLQLAEAQKRDANDAFKSGFYRLAGGHYRFAMLMLESLGELPALLMYFIIW